MRWYNSKVRAESKVSSLKQDKVTFTPRSIRNLIIVFELDTWSPDLNADFTLKDCLFEAVNLTTSNDPDKYCSSEYGIGFDSRSLFSLPNFDWGKNVIVFGVDNSSSVHIVNNKVRYLSSWCRSNTRIR